MPLKSKQPRIAPVTPPYDDETAAVLDLLGPPISLFRVFARRPALARGLHGWGAYYYSRDFGLTVRQRELVICRTTAFCGADYEWGIHVAFFAEKAGFEPDQVESLASGSAGDPCWSDASDSAVIAAVDELHATSDLSDESWANLVAGVGEDGALDVLLLAGWYHAISYAVRALRLPQEDGATALADHRRGT